MEIQTYGSDPPPRCPSCGGPLEARDFSESSSEDAEQATLFCAECVEEVAHTDLDEVYEDLGGEA